MNWKTACVFFLITVVLAKISAKEEKTIKCITCYPSCDDPKNTFVKECNKRNVVPLIWHTSEQRSSENGYICIDLHYDLLGMSDVTTRYRQQQCLEKQENICERLNSTVMSQYAIFRDCKIVDSVNEPPQSTTTETPATTTSSETPTTTQEPSDAANLLPFLFVILSAVLLLKHL